MDAVIGCLYSRYCLYPTGYIGENKLFLPIGNSPMWFLTAMFVSSCIFYFVIECINERREYLYIWSVAFIILTICLEQLPILLPWSLDTAFLGVFFMLIGYYGKNIFLSNVRWKVLISTLLIYLICCYYNDGINISIRRYGSHGVASIIAVCIIGVTGSLLCVCGSKKIELIPIVRDIFDYIGRNSILILALHVIMFNIFDLLLDWMGIPWKANGLICYAIGLIRLTITTGVCYCISCFRKRILVKMR